jgi:hypothetical protein
MNHPKVTPYPLRQGRGQLDLPLYITSALYATAVTLFYILLRGVEGTRKIET